MRWHLQTLLWLSLLGLAASPMRAAGCEKTVRWNDDPPFSMKQADGEIVGQSISPVREVLRRMGCTAVLIQMPWARALTDLEAGRLDVLPGALRNPEREHFAYFSIPGPQSHNGLFVHSRDERRWRSLAELKGSGFRLGAQIGVSYGPEYDRLMREPEFAQAVQKNSSRRNLWLMLDAGRIDGVLADEQTARAELRQLGLQDKVQSSGLLLSHPPAAVAFSKKNVGEDFVTQYNKVMEAMLQDGSYAAIQRRYAQP